MQATTHKARERAPAFMPAQQRQGFVSLFVLAAVVVALLVVGSWFLVDYLTPTDTEALLRDYVSDWEAGDLADLSDYFTINGTLVNATTGSSITLQDIEMELTRLADGNSVDVHGLVVGSSDRIATARFEIISPTGDGLDGVSTWEIVGGAIRQQTISHVTMYESSG